MLNSIWIKVFSILYLFQSILASNTGFTIVIATYQRDHLIPSLLSHLITSPPPSLKAIVLIWQNVGTPLPSFLEPSALTKLTAHNPSLTISVRISEKNSMNERFKFSTESIQTESVLILDDDIVLTNSVLEWGYQEFLLVNPLGTDAKDGRITGFTPRDFVEITRGIEWEYLLRSKESYSMILSNAAWIRTEWMELYWAQTEEMIKLREYVDEVFNCDDILLNYLVSNYTHLPPLLLQPIIPLRTILTPGLWNQSRSSTSSQPASITPAPTTPSPPTIPKLNHFQQRTQCLHKFFHHFSKFNPEPLNWSSYPLLQISSAVTQNVQDRSRVMRKGESWDEESEIWIPATDVSSKNEGEGNGEEGRDQREWDERLKDMSDEEIVILMNDLEDEMRREDEEAVLLEKTVSKEEDFIITRGIVRDEL